MSCRWYLLRCTSVTRGEWESVRLEVGMSDLGGIWAWLGHPEICPRVGRGHHDCSKAGQRVSDRATGVGVRRAGERAGRLVPLALNSDKLKGALDASHSRLPRARARPPGETPRMRPRWPPALPTAPGSRRAAPSRDVPAPARALPSRRRPLLLRSCGALGAAAAERSVRRWEPAGSGQALALAVGEPSAAVRAGRGRGRAGAWPGAAARRAGQHDRRQQHPQQRGAAAFALALLRALRAHPPRRGDPMLRLAAALAQSQARALHRPGGQPPAEPQEEKGGEGVGPTPGRAASEGAA
jgi:hypothetical protein